MADQSHHFSCRKIEADIRQDRIAIDRKTEVLHGKGFRHIERFLRERNQGHAARPYV
ncbi:hypothetical protein D3C87_1927720 [compost metagenome]